MKNSKPKSNSMLNRRQFLQRASTTAAALATAPLIIPSRIFGADGQTTPNNKINLACIGVGGMGGSDVNGLAPYCNIVALCDVDSRRAAGTLEKFPAAKQFKDFRKMFAEAAASFDAVLVATPDHCHAVATMAALKHGKHVYCEKPLAHSVGEVRAVMKAAREAKVVTQLGNQGHSSGSIRDFVEWIQAGAIGQVHTIHAGSNAVNSGVDQLPSLKEPHAVPPALDWDLWLGPAKYRPYHPAYLPASWRGWTAFGNGTIGDWMCHVVDPVFWALDLGLPKTIVAKVKDYDPKTQGEAFPKGDVVTFEFPAKGNRGPITLHWYSGTERVPRPAEFAKDDPDIGAGAVVIGDQGKIAYGSHGAGGVRLIPDKRMDEYQRPPKTIPRVRSHHADFIEAIQRGTKAGSDFLYGGALTEIAMLGVIAIKLAGTKLEWDAAKMQFVNNPEANALVNPPARAGWEL
ncbi:MAG: Gfo/Idh/MocA family oxidoreductase [Verrucomicrobia subdivision 3 bacterium]|nr:Gfo/Idh/MocA family oxidoreductase [Limisphaerales bacterium]